MKCLTLACLLSLLSTLLCSAQQYPIRHYNIDAGLGHSNVFRVFQDKKGFLVFATSHGVNYFDGKQFTNYTTENGLSHNTIMSISEDVREDVKYIATYGGGICSMNGTSISEMKEVNRNLPRFTFYTYPQKDRLWMIARDTGTYLYYYNKDGLHQAFAEGAPKTLQFFFRIFNIDNTPYFATSDGVYYADQAGRVRRFMPDKIKGEIISIQKGTDGSYWFVQRDTLKQIKNDKEGLSISFKDKEAISQILVDRNDNIWIATKGAGVILLKHDNPLQKIYITNIPQTLINDIFQDNEGNIWFASHGQGVYRLSGLAVTEYPIAKETINVYCEAILPADGNQFIIGSIGTISMLSNNQLYPLAVTALKAENYVYFLERDARHLLIGTPSGVTKKLLKPPYTESSMYPEPVGALSICKRGGDTADIGSYSGLYHFANGMLRADPDAEIKGKRVNAIVRDHFDNTWLGTNRGIYSNATGRYARCTPPSFDENTSVNYIFRDRDSGIWFATDKGLVLYRDSKWRVFTTKDGLANDKCNAIDEDSMHRIWIGTMRGLCYVDKKSLAIKRYSQDIYFDEILTICCNKDNELLLGSVNGLTLLKTDVSDRYQQPLPNTYITSVKAGNSIYNFPDSISLQNYKDKIHLEYIGLSYKFSDLVEYRYKLDKLATTWVITKSNTIEFPTLPGGDYKLYISSRVANGQWGNNAILTIHVPTPFWQQKTVITVALLLLSVLISFATRKLINIYDRRKREQLIIFNKINYLKQQATSALINPHFIFNCMNSIQFFLNRNKVSEANSYLADFASLIRLTMENAEEAFIPLEDELERLQLYLSLEKLRFGERLSYSIDIDPTLGEGVLLPNMILQPYVENAIWHGITPKTGTGNIQIEFRKLNDTQLNIVIADNGVGLNKPAGKPANRKRHFGTRLTEERLNLLAKLLKQYYAVTIRELQDDEGNISGTEVRIELPLTPRQEELEMIKESLK